MGLIIRPAQKFQQYARVCLWGVPKAGKSYSALAIATTLAGKGGKVGVISSEYGSTALLSRKFPHDIIDLTTDETGNLVRNPFHPKRYEEAIGTFVEAGYQVIIIDSLSHAWEGPGGVLECVEKATVAAGHKNTFSDGWSEGTPLYHHLIQTIVSPVTAPVHVIVTLRAKDEYVMEKNARGKDAPRNVGLKPAFRKSFGFEMQVTIRMDGDLVGHVEASAYQEELPNGLEIERPGEDLAYTLMRFLEGAPPPERIPTLQESYKRGLLTGAWTKETFYATAGRALGVAVSREVTLEAGQLKQLAALAEAGAPDGSQVEQVA
jgi:hypothetical protein